MLNYNRGICSKNASIVAGFLADTFFRIDDNVRTMITTKTIATIDPAFRTLIKAQNYERYVLAIINRSRDIFQGLSFKHITNQSNGESDFKDSDGQLYDAKLLFDKKQGAMIGDEHNEITQWVQVMIDEKAEFGEVVRQRDLTLVTKTKLYQIAEKRSAKVKSNEHVIFFIPFPIVDEYKGSVIQQFASDCLQAVYNALIENECVGNRRVYFIYPSGEPHEYVLRDDRMHREYICCEELDDFITFETHTHYE